MKIPVSSILIALAVIPIGATMLEPPTDAQVAMRTQRQAEQTQQADQRAQAIEKQKQGRIALDRVKAGCVSIVDATTKEERPIVAGDPVVKAGTDGEYGANPGGFLCNSQGHTAVADMKFIDNEWYTVATDVIVITPELKAQYDEFYNLMR